MTQVHCGDPIPSVRSHVRRGALLCLGIAGLRAVVAVPMLLGAAPVLARGAGVSVASVVAPKTSQSAPIAVNVARLAADTVRENADLSPISLEVVLEGGAEPAWLVKKKDAERARERGRNATDAVELPVAADAFAEAIVAYEQAVAGITDIAPVVETLIEQGKVYALVGDGKAARRSFERALALDPAYRLARDGVPKAIQAAFDAVVKDQKNIGRGTLTIYATVGAAEVWVDGVFRGIAPISVDVPVGRHYVRVFREGSVPFGAGVDAKRGAEATVQAALRPTGDLSSFEAALGKIAREEDSLKPVQELAAALKVERLLSIVAEDTGGTARVHAVYVDGVSGKELSRATKAFAVNDPFFERDVKGFLQERLARLASVDGKAPTVDGNPLGQGTANAGGGGTGAGSGTGAGAATGSSLLPGDAAPVETPGSVVGGWTLVGTSAVPIIGAAALAVLSINNWQAYRSRTQLDPQLEQIRSVWLLESVLADAGVVVGGAMIGGGIALLVTGYAEMAAKEEVVK